MAPWTKASSSISGTLSLIRLMSSRLASLPRIILLKPISLYIFTLSLLRQDAWVERWSSFSGKFFLKNGTVPISETMKASKGQDPISSFSERSFSICFSRKRIFRVQYTFFPVFSFSALTFSASSMEKLPALALKENSVIPMYAASAP